MNFVPSLTSKVTYFSQTLTIRGESLLADGSYVAIDTPIERSLVDGDLIYQSLKELGLLDEDLAKVIRVKVGDRVKLGETLAISTGLFGFLPISVKASASGVIENISLSTGHIALRTAPEEKVTKAPISGLVRCVDSRHLSIDSYGLLIQGLFGIGQRDFGIVKKYINPDDINLLDFDGDIIILKNSPNIETLLKLKDAKKAVITGSISSDVLDTYLGYELGIPVTGNEEIKPALILTEGFGAQPMSSFDLISDGALISFDPTTQVRCGAVRPFLFAASQENEIRKHLEAKKRSSSKEDNDSNSWDDSNNHLKIGSRARIIRGENYGLIGEVVELPTDPHTFPNGVKVAIAVIKAKDCHSIPLQNLELIDS